ncbi:hypothetical protein [Streptomyces sp. NPDC101132]|uniref:hypothetical protein n=1 Tax=Streptomyces sp. NPDC101132 TaxID=3366110 RepID=UPI00382CAB46
MIRYEEGSADGAAARRAGGFYTAQVVDADAADPPWLVTAYVPGPSLHEAVAEERPDVGELLLRMAVMTRPVQRGVRGRLTPDAALKLAATLVPTVPRAGLGVVGATVAADRWLYARPEQPAPGVNGPGART